MGELCESESCQHQLLFFLFFPVDYMGHGADLEFSLELLLICSAVWDYSFHSLRLSYKMRVY